MNLYANLRERIKPNSITHVVRYLPAGGNILVKAGQEVAPHDILGKYEMVGGFTVLNIAKLLNISPKDGAKYIQRGVGLKIFQGELLASKKGFFSQKIVKSPTDGVVDEYNNQNGELRIKLLSRQQQVTSGVFGIVDSINQEAGEAIIKTKVTEIFGVFGSGKQRSGVITLLGNRDSLLDNSKITAQQSKQILVTGALIYNEALKRAAGYGVYGIISGGLNVRDFKSMANSIDPMHRIGNDVGITVMSTEGFGPLPIGEDIFNLIKAHDGQFAFISGNSPKLLLPTSDPDSIISLRKIALPVINMIERQPEVLEREIVVGAKVRLIGPPQIGSQGIIVAIDQTPTKLESGIVTYLLTVETISRKFKVPYPNIELIL